MRRGFTLIELLTVVSIMILLLSITLMIAPRRSHRHVDRAVMDVQTMLSACRNQAVRDRSSIGLRFTSEDGINYTGFLRVETPQTRIAPMAPAYVEVPAKRQPNRSMLRCVGFSTEGILPGDYFEYVEGNQGICKVRSVNGDYVLLESPPPISSVTDYKMEKNYRFIRSVPRPLLGESPHQLPTDAVIPIADCWNLTGDIMFDATGKLIGSHQIVIWVGDIGNTEKRQSITVYPTGVVVVGD